MTEKLLTGTLSLNTTNQHLNRVLNLNNVVLSTVICPKDADGMANGIDPDQITSVGAFSSGSTLFAQTCLSENFGSLP